MYKAPRVQNDDIDMDNRAHFALPQILLAIHLVAENSLLDTTNRFDNLTSLAPILGWLGRLAGRADYVGWWERWAGEYAPLSYDKEECEYLPQYCNELTNS